MKFQKDLENQKFAIIRKTFTRPELKKVIGMNLQQCIEYFCALSKIRHYFNLLYDDIDLCLDKGLLQQKYKVSENRYVWPNYYIRNLLFVYPCRKAIINGKAFRFEIGDLLFIDPEILIDFGEHFDQDDYAIQLTLKPTQSFA
jgi:hypothetical protein